jgi:hypothetical protein
MSRHSGPRTVKASNAVDLLKAGMKPKAVAAKVGMKPSTVDVLYLRWVIYPEWEQMKLERDRELQQPRRYPT